MLIAVIAVAAFLAFQRVVPDIDIEQLLEDVSDVARRLDLRCWSALLAFLETGAFVGLVVPGRDGGDPRRRGRRARARPRS